MIWSQPPRRQHTVADGACRIRKKEKDKRVFMKEIFCGKGGRISEYPLYYQNKNEAP